MTAPHEPAPHEPLDNETPSWRRAGQLGSIGLEMVVAVVAGGWAGSWADRTWGFDGGLTLLGLFIGVCAAGRSVARLVRQMRQ